MEKEAVILALLGLILLVATIQAVQLYGIVSAAKTVAPTPPAQLAGSAAAQQQAPAYQQQAAQAPAGSAAEQVGGC